MKKKIIIFGLSFSLLFSNLIFASPSFYRTNKEWASLKDNVLEFSEIKDLIEEYNKSVKLSEGVYIKFIKDYGISNSSVKEAYRQAAETIRSSIVEPDPSSPAYISQIMNNASVASKADSLEMSADTSLEDALIMKLNTDNLIASLSLNASVNMIEYYNAGLEIKKAELNAEIAKQEENVAELNFKLGLNTKENVLNAKAQSLNVAKDIENKTKKRETSLKTLQTMTGWSYEAQAEIKELPDVDTYDLAKYNKVSDLEKAIENNISLKILKRKLENADASDIINTLNTSIANAKVNISLNIDNSYKNIFNAKSAYELAKSNTSLKELEYNLAVNKNNVALLSRNELNKKFVDKEIAIIDEALAKNALLLSIITYEWNVNGLASTGER